MGRFEYMADLTLSFSPTGAVWPSSPLVTLAPARAANTSDSNSTDGSSSSSGGQAQWRRRADRPRGGRAEEGGPRTLPWRSLHSALAAAAAQPGMPRGVSNLAWGAGATFTSGFPSTQASGRQAWGSASASQSSADGGSSGGGIADGWVDQSLQSSFLDMRAGMASTYHLVRACEVDREAPGRGAKNASSAGALKKKSGREKCPSAHAAVYSAWAGAGAGAGIGPTARPRVDKQGERLQRAESHSRWRAAVLHHRTWHVSSDRVASDAGAGGGAGEYDRSRDDSVLVGNLWCHPQVGQAMFSFSMPVKVRIYRND